MEKLDALVSVGKLTLDIVITTNGGSNPGTWMCPELAVEYCRWLDPVFGMQANQLVYAVAVDAIKVTSGKPEVETKTSLATNELKAEFDPLKDMLSSIGVSDAYIKSIFLEKCLIKEIEHDVTIIPEQCKPMLKSTDTIEFDKTQGKHAVVITHGFVGVSASEIASRIGVKADDVNRACVALGWCYRTQTSPYYHIVTSSGKKFAQATPTVSKNHGTVEKITAWYADAVIPHLKKYFEQHKVKLLK